MYSELAWVLVSSGTQVPQQIVFDLDYLPDYFSVAYDYGMACLLFCAASMLLIEECWFMLILSCCVVTEVARITDEVWITDEPFAVARGGVVFSLSFF